MTIACVVSGLRGGKWLRPLAFVALAVAAGGCSGGGDAQGTGGANNAGTSGSSGTSGSGTGGGAGVPADDGTTSLSGTLGDLGPLVPTVSSFVISNSGETLVYLTSTAITCDTLTTSRWLGSIEAGSQVVEIVVKSSFTTGTATVGGSPNVEVNYAKGGRSSSYEQNAASGTVTFTSNTPSGPVAGTVNTRYENPTGSVSGRFHAEFCDGGQGY